MKKELKDFIYFMDEENIEKLNKEICKNFYLKNEEIKDKNIEKNEINKFEKLKYENQNFYKAEIMTKEDSNYTISSHGIDIKGLVLKVGTVSNSDLGIIEDMVVNLIEVSDKNSGT